MEATQGVELPRTRSIRARLAPWAGAAAVALAGLVVAMTQISIAGHWQGVFVLRGKDGPALEVKDDLFLGDGSRLLAGVSFSRVRRVLSGEGPAAAGAAWLALEWDDRVGSGIVENHLADGTELVTLFGRYQDSQGRTPQGLFVGGAIPDVAADEAKANDSGMAFHDARGWHHVWCSVNEGILDTAARAMSYPSQWRLLGTRVLIHDRDRVVLESSHELRVGGGTLQMDRFAYFRAGKPWFKLGIRIVNTSEVPVSYSYAYGDEPWVGDFGSAKGNVGWHSGGIVRLEGLVDPVAHRWAGILDEDSGIANFASWLGGDMPDDVYFSNHPGATGVRIGSPLDSNEIFIGLQWNDRVLAPGEDRSMLLAFGLAPVDEKTHVPSLPEGAGPP